MQKGSLYKLSPVALAVSVLLIVGFASVAVAEDCVSFNPDSCQVKQMGTWKIVDGSHSLLDFGSNKAEADQALKIIKHYKMNSHCFVGRPGPSMDYWLVNGSSPVGTMSGEDAISFNLNNIQVKQLNNSWKIVDGNNWLLDFGASKAEADEAFQIIKKYGFTHICYVGRPGPSMVYFRKNLVLHPMNPIILPVKPVNPPLLPLTPVIQEDCLQFNYNNVKAEKVNGNWTVTDGTMAMLNYGTNEANAKKAVDVMKFYKMTSQCFVGRPGPSMQYYLATGKSPVGAFPGEDALSFNPTTIEVKQINGRWKIVDGSHWILDFDTSKEEADKSFAIIKKYGFKYICFVGRPNAPMQYFRQ